MYEKNFIKHQEWRKKLEQFYKSGLSGPEWCRLNDESHRELRYYKSVNKAPEKVTFQQVEPSSPQLPSLEISLGSIVIKLSAPVNPETLELCLHTLKKI